MNCNTALKRWEYNSESLIGLNPEVLKVRIFEINKEKYISKYISLS